MVLSRNEQWIVNLLGKNPLFFVFAIHKFVLTKKILSREKNRALASRIITKIKFFKFL